MDKSRSALLCKMMEALTSLADDLDTLDNTSLSEAARQSINKALVNYTDLLANIAPAFSD